MSTKQGAFTAVPPRNLDVLNRLKNITPFFYALGLSAIWTGIAAVLMSRDTDLATINAQSQLLSLSLNFTIYIWVLTSLRVGLPGFMRDANNSKNRESSAFADGCASRFFLGLLFGGFMILLPVVNGWTDGTINVFGNIISVFWSLALVGFLIGFILRELLPVIFAGSVVLLLLLMGGML